MVISDSKTFAAIENKANLGPANGTLFVLRHGIVLPESAPISAASRTASYLKLSTASRRARSPARWRGAIGPSSWCGFSFPLPHGDHYAVAARLACCWLKVLPTRLAGDRLLDVSPQHAALSGALVTPTVHLNSAETMHLATGCGSRDSSIHQQGRIWRRRRHRVPLPTAIVLAEQRHERLPGNQPDPPERLRQPQ
jgi:hypothetical protein